MNEKIIKNDLKSLLSKFMKDDTVKTFLSKSSFENVKNVSINDVVDNSYIKDAKIPSDKITLSERNIEANGFLTPLIVRKKRQKYELIIGRIPYFASKELKLKEVPILEVELSDEESLLLLIAEIRERKIMNFYELSLACYYLKKDFKYKNKDLASYLNFSESQISNLLRIINMPDEVKVDISYGKLSYGHAKAISRLEKEDIIRLKEEIYAKNLSVRDVEKIVRKIKNKDSINEESSLESDEYSITLNFSTTKDKDKALKLIKRMIWWKRINIK